MDGDGDPVGTKAKSRAHLSGRNDGLMFGEELCSEFFFGFC